jgi:4'-phosphopantetheinyl transferase
VITILKPEAFISIGVLNLNEFSFIQPNLSKRELEKAGIKHLLDKLFIDSPANLQYTVTNKPYLADRKEHISISHSHDYLVIIVNEKENTGIDIELIRDVVLKVQYKFLNKTELNFAGNNIEKLITLWAAKEALYKVYGLKGLDFKTNLIIDDFSGDILIGKIETETLKKKYKLKCETLGEYKMVYILNEI